MTEAGRTEHPTWTNNQWRDYFFGTGPSTNGTFTPDASDEIQDGHAGMSFVTTTYLVNPPTSDLYKDKVQTYTCNSDAGNLSQSYTVRRIAKATTGAIRIKKFP